MLTLPWRKKEEGFHWVKHENTQIRIKREAREEKLSALGYFLRSTASLFALKLLEFFEYLLRKSRQAGAATLRWIAITSPRLKSSLSAGFARLARTTTKSARWSASMMALMVRRFGQGLSWTGRQIARGTAAMAGVIGPAGRKGGAKLLDLSSTGANWSGKRLAAGLAGAYEWTRAQLADLPASFANIGEASQRATSVITQRIVDQKQIVIYAAISIVIFAGAVSAVSLGIFSQLPGSSVLAGKARVIDADLIRIGDSYVRLYGIDAPEPNQRCKRRRNGRANWRCGSKATRRLSKLINGRKVECTRKGTDHLGRLVGQCFLRKRDIGAYMIGRGLAWSTPGDPGNYQAAQAAAQKRRLGVWRATSNTPWSYREARWQQAKERAPDGCPVKGNISRAGHIYYLPWSNRYDRIKIQPTKGERWFCNEHDAISAGFRLTRWP